MKEHSEYFNYEKLTPEELQQFNEQGYLIIKNILKQEGLEQMQKECMTAWEAEKQAFDPNKSWLQNSLLVNIHHKAKTVRDYYFEGQAEYTRVRGTSATSGNLQKGDAYQGADYNPSGYGDNFDKYYRFLYGAVNRTNYVIENVNKMLATASPSSVATLETIIGEARLLRGMIISV